MVAVDVLKIMEKDLLECIDGLSKKNPMYDVVAQRVEAIQYAMNTIKAVDAVHESMVSERRCIMCGRPVFAGMTNADGDFYVHGGECFEKYMDSVYGEHQWMMLGDDATDGEGGYYIVTDDDAEEGFSGTGIFYTEWEDDEDGEPDDKAEDEGTVSS